MLKAGDFQPKPRRKPSKLSKALKKRILTFAEDLENLKCQRYEKGKCSEFSLDPANLADFCPVCQINTGMKLVRSAAEKFNPKQIKY